MRNFFKNNQGTTLVETLIATAFFLVVSLAIYNAWGSIVQLNQRIKVKEIIITLANEEFETIRNMPYADIGIDGGVPDGTLDPQTDYIREGYTFRVERYIRNIDDPFDGTQGGTPDDDSPADRKLVELKLRCLECQVFVFETFTTTIAPKGLESSTGNGSLKLTVIDADGDPVPAANVYIDNYTANPNIVIRDETDVNGTLTVVDAPPYTQAYEIRVDKTAQFSSDQTYDSTDLGGSTPVVAHATVIENELTQVTLSIDRFGDANITSVDSSCVAVPNFDFNMNGAKIIGTSPTVYKYDEAHATNASGIEAVADLEWDTYSIESNDGTYEIIGANPLIDFVVDPNQSQDVELVVGAKNTPTILVTVKDQNTGLPVDDADVTLTQIAGGTNVYTDTTYRGSFSQTDWVGGPGQNDYTDETMFSQRSNINYATTGQITLTSSAGVYAPAGNLRSSSFDTGSPSTWGEITWTPVSQPAQTGSDSVKFQIATNDDNLTWNYLGPDGTSSTYYTTSNQTINAIHDNQRYIRYRAYLTTSNTAYTPSVTDVSITHTTGCTPSGQVVFQNVSTGTYEVLVEKTGYNDGLVTTTATSGSWQNVEVFISEG